MNRKLSSYKRPVKEKFLSDQAKFWQETILNVDVPLMFPNKLLGYNLRLLRSAMTGL